MKITGMIAKFTAVTATALAPFLLAAPTAHAAGPADAPTAESANVTTTETGTLQSTSDPWG